MKIVFRTDASVQIGTGHVMRCLTLADALRKAGASCTFICRAHTGNLLEKIRQRGHVAIALIEGKTKTQSKNEVILNHADWLGSDWENDATETRQALGRAMFDWLIVDHYALDASWEKMLRPYCKRIMVIDDLADRAHDCDLLLDQNLGRLDSDYGLHIPSTVSTLIGPQFALLRPEFGALRNYSLNRRRRPQLKHLLICMGGVDKNNATEEVLDALCKSPLAPDTQIRVVMGMHAPWQDNVRKLASQMPWNTEVLINVENMAELLCHCDLAIGASGSSNWERCCLGIPSLLLVLAENQKSSAKAIHEAGAAYLLNIENISESLASTIEKLTKACTLATMSRVASTLNNGDGVTRVMTAMQMQFRIAKSVGNSSLYETRLC